MKTISQNNSNLLKGIVGIIVSLSIFTINYLVNYQIAIDKSSQHTATASNAIAPALDNAGAEVLRNAHTFTVVGFDILATVFLLAAIGAIASHYIGRIITGIGMIAFFFYVISSQPASAAINHLYSATAFYQKIIPSMQFVHNFSYEIVATILAATFIFGSWCISTWIVLVGKVLFIENDRDGQYLVVSDKEVDNAVIR